MNRNLTNCVTAAMFAALTCVFTMVVKVPTIGTNGYVNIGDAVVLVSAWILGSPYGALAAGIGSAMADLLSGYAAYAPGTFVIKFAMAFVCCLVFKCSGRIGIPGKIAFVLSGIIAELIMVSGYFIYEAGPLGYGMAAAASVPSNMIQGVTCLVLGSMLAIALSRFPVFKARIER